MRTININWMQDAGKFMDGTFCFTWNHNSLSPGPHGICYSSFYEKFLSKSSTTLTCSSMVFMIWEIKWKHLKPDFPLRSKVKFFNDCYVDPLGKHKKVFVTSKRTDNYCKKMFTSHMLLLASYLLFHYRVASIETW